LTEIGTPVIIENDYHYQEAVTNNIHSQDWLDLLQHSGCRLTTPRQVVVEIMAASEYTLSPTEVYLQASQRCPGLGLVSVYRTLEKLEELGLITRVHLKDGCHSYIASAQGHQHLLICQTCNRAEYFSGDDLTPLIENLGSERGFDIRGHWLQLFGTCAACQDPK
jgi:Fur family transcriptional regulator, ferric uptake regulator